jgi:hypothetical protein
MAKRNRTTTLERIIRYFKEGRGRGRGKAYNPYLHIQDVPSIGLVTRDLGWHTGRVHHLMSLVEWMFFLILEWSTIVVDIREQYPLDREKTVAIANDLGILHPTDKKTKEPIVMTSDFVITIKKPIGTEDLVYSAKLAKDLSNIQTVEKLEIERVLWSYTSSQWFITTELDIDPVLSKNIELVHPFYYLHLQKSLTKDLVRAVEEIVVPRLHAESQPLMELTDQCDVRLGLKPGTSINAVYHLIATRRLPVDMSIPIEAERILKLKSKQEKRATIA